eukprot:jgi/Psemu1/287499/fgenesh1_pg.194_\
MESTYQRLADRAIELYRSGKGTGLDGRCWIAVTGGPGAGKSTLAAAVADRINQRNRASFAAAVNGTENEWEGREANTNTNTKAKANTKTKTKTPAAVAIPMDGYHLTRAELAELSQSYGPDYSDDESRGLSRRGAPWTFDPQALAVDLAEAKRSGKASLPDYDRALSDPVEHSVTVDPSHTIVLVEGIYLLLGKLEAELERDDEAGEEFDQPREGSNLKEACSDLRCPFPIGPQIRRWKATAELWDETWFVSPPYNDNDGSCKETPLEIQTRRIVERSLETWTKAKTEAWGGGTDREAAIRRAESNDVRNARLIHCCRDYADLIVDSI